MLSIGLPDVLFVTLGLLLIAWFLMKISAMEGHLKRLVEQGERRGRPGDARKHASDPTGQMH